MTSKENQANQHGGSGFGLGFEKWVDFLHVEMAERSLLV